MRNARVLIPYNTLVLLPGHWLEKIITELMKSKDTAKTHLHHALYAGPKASHVKYTFVDFKIYCKSIVR